MKFVCRTLFLAMIAATMAGCDEVEPRAASVLTRDHLFFDFSIAAAEDKDDVTVRLEFRHSSKGKGLLLTDSAKVELDGEVLIPDSSKYSGVFYEASKSRSDFVGKHTIKFTGSDGKTLQEEFWFLPIRLEEELPAKISRKSFSIQVHNPDTALKVFQLVLVDTSFKSEDVNDDVQVNGGRIDITQDMFQRVVNGPVIFELHSEKIRPLSQKPPRGGRLAIFYSMNREFELTE